MHPIYLALILFIYNKYLCIGESLRFNAMFIVIYLTPILFILSSIFIFMFQNNDTLGNDLAGGCSE